MQAILKYQKFSLKSDLKLLFVVFIVARLRWSFQLLCGLWHTPPWTMGKDHSLIQVQLSYTVLWPASAHCGYRPVWLPDGETAGY